MTCEKSYLEELHPYSNSYVIFSNVARGRIKCICKLVSWGLPYLDDVLLVEGFIANLISISQICDQGLNVNFKKSKCIVSSKGQKVLMKVTISKDNYYSWVSQNKILKEKSDPKCNEI